MVEETGPEQTPKVNGFLTLAHARDLVLVLLFGVVAIKVLLGNVNIQVETVSVTDLLALVLALFSIALSAAFYFKATETSNQFYRDTFLFTKQTSELLGRIEAGFGEKLLSINQNQGQLRDEFTKMWSRVDPSNGEAETKKVREDAIREKQETVASAVREQRAIIEHLLQKSNLAEKEKHEMREELKKREAELVAAQSELATLKAPKTRDSLKPLRLSAAEFLLNAIVRGTPTISKKLNLHREDLRVGYMKIRDSLPVNATQELVDAGYVTKDGESLTVSGVEALTFIWSNEAHRRASQGT